MKPISCDAQAIKIKSTSRRDLTSHLATTVIPSMYGAICRALPGTVVAILFTLTLTACTTAEVTSRPDGKTPGPSKAAAQAKIGDTISLKGNERGLKIAVTVVRVSPSAKGKDEFNQPEKGQRFVAVQIGQKNVGSIAYDDTPGNGVSG